MKVTITGATGRVGTGLVAALRARGDDVIALSRDPEAASERLGTEALAWDLQRDAAPVAGLEGRDAVVHLAGEDVGQRWTKDVKERIRTSRELGTRHLVAGLEQAGRRPPLLVCASASGYYGARGGEPVEESSPPGRDWLADVCVRWEREAQAAEALGVRVVRVRTGVVLDAEGGALAKMLPPFRAGLGGPVAGGDQYIPWIHRDDLIGLYAAVLDSADFSGPVNASAPAPVTNARFAKALGRALHRPAVAPVPALAVKTLFGEMAQIVTTGVNMVPGRVDELGYTFLHPELDGALADALGAS